MLCWNIFLRKAEDLPPLSPIEVLSYSETGHGFTFKRPPGLPAAETPLTSAAPYQQIHVKAMWADHVGELIFCGRNDDGRNTASLCI